MIFIGLKNHKTVIDQCILINTLKKSYLVCNLKLTYFHHYLPICAKIEILKKVKCHFNTFSIIEGHLQQNIPVSKLRSILYGSKVTNVF